MERGWIGMKKFYRAIVYYVALILLVVLSFQLGRGFEREQSLKSVTSAIQSDGLEWRTVWKNNKRCCKTLVRT
jgi:hypothetical protein